MNNMKRLIFCIAIFVSVFIGTFIFLFPYRDVVSSNLNLYAGRFMLFRDIDSEPFVTNIYGVDIIVPRFGRVYLGDLKVSYSPFSVLTGHAMVNINSPYVHGVIEHRNGFINFSGMIEPSQTSKLIGRDISGSVIEMKVFYNYKDMQGEYELKSSKINFSYQGMDINADNLFANGNIASRIVNVKEFSFGGMAAVKASGQIRIDTEQLQRSALALNGTAGMMGISEDFSLSGTIEAPRIQIK